VVSRYGWMTITGHAAEDPAMELADRPLVIEVITILPAMDLPDEAHPGRYDLSPAG